MPSDAYRFLVIALEHPEAGDRPEHMRLRCGWRPVFDEREGAVECAPSTVPGAAIPQGSSDQCLRLGRAVAVARGEQRVAGCLECFELALVRRKMQRATPPEQQVRALGPLAVGELECLVVQLAGVGERVQRERTVSGVTQGVAGVLRDAGGRLSRGAEQLERTQVVVGDHLGLILGPAERSDPRRGLLMLLGSLRPRDLAVRDVADEQMPERILGLPRHRRAALPTDELLALERVQPFLRDPALDLAERRGGAQPEDLPDDRRVLKERLFLCGEPVDARGEQPLNRLRHSELLHPVVRLEHSRELLGVQRVPACALEQRLVRVGLERRPRQEHANELRRLVVAERRQRQRERMRLPAAPARATREQLGARGPDDEQWHAAGPVDEVVDEVEQTVVGEVQVFEDEHERVLLRERLEEAPPRGERLAAAVGACLAGGLEPDERPEVALEPLRVVGVGDQRGDRFSSFSSVRAESSVSRTPACALTISPSAQ